MSEFLMISNLMRLANEGKKLPEDWNDKHIETLRKRWVQAVESGEKTAKSLEFFDSGAYGKPCPECGGIPQKFEKEITFGGKTLGTHIYWELKCDCETKYDRQLVLNIDRRSRLIRADIPESYKDMTWKSWDKTVDRGLTDSVSKAYKLSHKPGINDLIGQGAVLFGDVGRGKTLTGICMIKAIIHESKLKCRYIPMADLTSRIMRSGQEGDYLDRLEKYDVLFLDDLDKLSTSSSWVQERVFSLFDSMFRSKKTLIVSTNLKSIPEMEDYFGVHGEAIISRMVDKMEFIRFIGGDDYRKKRRAEKINNRSVDN